MCLQGFGNEYLLLSDNNLLKTVTSNSLQSKHHHDGLKESLRGGGKKRGTDLIVAAFTNTGGDLFGAGRPLGF